MMSHSKSKKENDFQRHIGVQGQEFQREKQTTPDL